MSCFCKIHSLEISSYHPEPWTSTEKYNVKRLKNQCSYSNRKLPKEIEIRFMIFRSISFMNYRFIYWFLDNYNKYWNFSPNISLDNPNTGVCNFYILQVASKFMITSYIHLFLRYLEFVEQPDVWMIICDASSCFSSNKTIRNDVSEVCLYYYINSWRLILSIFFCFDK